MKSRLLQACLAVALVFGGYTWGHHSLPVVHAQGTNVAIPKAWGHIVAFAGSTSMVLEDSSGTIRFVSPDDGKVLAEVDRK